MKKIINIEGMSCENCVKHVTESLENINELDSVKVSLLRNAAKVESKEDVEDEKLKKAIEDAGYKVTSVENA
ncbi:heavy-metal-associated domain-containing protein [Peptoniphilus obesi]|uniref:heavy-metal-associated domain-containing protein n=1 Tax=Peptoniphilus obesi TaxID=1472765 RepID=UPI0004AE3656|nr:heavy metal-associated domain-containing protein [Peptoniphilus obesi]